MQLRKQTLKETWLKINFLKIPTHCQKLLIYEVQSRVCHSSCKRCTEMLRYIKPNLKMCTTGRVSNSVPYVYTKNKVHSSCVVLLVCPIVVLHCFPLGLP